MYITHNNSFKILFIPIAFFLFLSTFGISFGQTPTEIYFDSPQYLKTDRITIFVIDPIESEYVHVKINVGDFMREIEAFELDDSPGKFMASFYPSSFLLGNQNTITGTYTFTNQNSTIYEISTNSTLVDVVEVKEPVESHEFSLNIYDKNNSTIASANSGDSIFIRASGDGILYLKILHIFHGLEHAHTGTDRFDLKYDLKTSGVYQIVLSNVNSTGHVENIFKDLFVFSSQSISQPNSTKTPPADTPPADTPPADTPPADTPPADTPPADTPPADTPPADTPPADTPPADTPPAIAAIDNSDIQKPSVDISPVDTPVDTPIDTPSDMDILPDTDTPIETPSDTNMPIETPADVDTPPTNTKSAETSSVVEDSSVETSFVIPPSIDSYPSYAVIGTLVTIPVLAFLIIYGKTRKNKRHTSVDPSEPVEPEPTLENGPALIPSDPKTPPPKKIEKLMSCLFEKEYNLKQLDDLYPSGVFADIRHTLSHLLSSLSGLEGTLHDNLPQESLNPVRAEYSKFVTKTSALKSRLQESGINPDGSDPSPVRSDLVLPGLEGFVSRYRNLLEESMDILRRAPEFSSSPERHLRRLLDGHLRTDDPGLSYRIGAIKKTNSALKSVFCSCGKFDL